ncbi:MAG TPA: hypothetical protein VFV58_10080 [Blastocatellia bacterium]|jgi:hypothetical protein|nr:hypothetical protein [Blastocatellia bacterium]
MEKSLTFNDQDTFYIELLDLESRKEEYCVETGIMEARYLPLRLLHHVGLSKDDIAHAQHKAVGGGSAWMQDYVEPMVVKFNEMIGKYKLASNYEFTVQAEDFDTIKIHGRPREIGTTV